MFRGVFGLLGRLRGLGARQRVQTMRLREVVSGEQRRVGNGTSWYSTALLCSVAGALLLTESYRRTHNCGIIAYLGDEPIASSVIMKALDIMQPRGYDSAGIATIHNRQELRVSKYASDAVKVSDALDRLRVNISPAHDNSNIGIGHTRWRTHGGLSDVNAHPHCDHKNRIALVHNGTITNMDEILRLLLSQGLQPKSETDTEIIALLIGWYLDEGHPLIEAVKLALSRLKGTWGIALVSHENPDKIIVARQGSPMLIGIGDRKLFAASEISAFAHHTRDYIALEDGELVVLDLNSMDHLAKTRMETADESHIHESLGKYTHWIRKEIEEQPKSMARAMNFGARLTRDSAKLMGLEKEKEELLKIENLSIIGCGSSLHAAMFGVAMFKELGLMHTVYADNASEFTAKSVPRHGAGVIAISQSGETRDVIIPVERLVAQHVPCLSIVNDIGSQLSRLTKCGVYLNAGKEVSVPSTKSFTSSCIVLTEIALWFSKGMKPEDSQRRQEIVAELMRLPMLAGSVIEKCQPQMKAIAQEILDQHHIFVLGRGLGEPIAREAALKIKEIGYIHAEGYPASELKHGPFALIEPGTPVILLILDDEHKEMMNLALAEVFFHGGKTIVLTTDRKLVNEKYCSHIVEVEEDGVMSALLMTIPLQYLAYFISVLKGNNPDKPRNLAKKVTVS